MKKHTNKTKKKISFSLKAYHAAKKHTIKKKGLKKRIMGNPATLSENAFPYNAGRIPAKIVVRQRTQYHG